MGAYPEHERLKAVQVVSQAIGEFLEDSGFILCEPTGHEVIPYAPVSGSINQILATYFGIDLSKIEEEKRAMLATLGGGI